MLHCKGTVDSFSDVVEGQVNGSFPVQVEAKWLMGLWKTTYIALSSAILSALLPEIGKEKKVLHATCGSKSTSA